MAQQTLVCLFLFLALDDLLNSSDIKEFRCIDEEVEEGRIGGAGDDDCRSKDQGDEGFLPGKKPRGGVMNAPFRSNDEEADDAG